LARRELLCRRPERRTRHWCAASWKRPTRGDLETLDELLAPDFVDHSLLPGQEPGREGYMQGVVEDLAALSNRHSTVEYQATNGDDMMVTRLTTRSIHDRGAYLGILAPTGQEYESQGIVIHRIEGDRIAEE
jgi:ketosteroid isomerase-like protein